MSLDGQTLYRSEPMGLALKSFKVFKDFSTLGTLKGSSKDLV